MHQVSGSWSRCQTMHTRRARQRAHLFDTSHLITSLSWLGLRGLKGFNPYVHPLYIRVSVSWRGRRDNEYGVSRRQAHADIVLALTLAPVPWPANPRNCWSVKLRLDGIVPRDRSRVPLHSSTEYRQPIYPPSLVLPGGGTCTFCGILLPWLFLCRLGEPGTE